MTAGQLSPVPKLSPRLKPDAQMEKKLKQRFFYFFKLKLKKEKKTLSMYCSWQVAYTHHPCITSVPTVSLVSISFFMQFVLLLFYGHVCSSFKSSVFLSVLVCLLIYSIIYVFNPLFSVDFIGGFDPFPLYHVNEKPSHLLLKPMYL